MIENDQQFQITMSWIREFQNVFLNTQEIDLLTTAHKKAMESQLYSLWLEVFDYLDKTPSGISIRINKHDVWWGVYWNKPRTDILDIYICLIPTLPIHIHLRSRK